MKKFQVIEDNGGGLTLAVFNESDKVDYLHNGYEYIKGQLLQDIQALKNGDDPAIDWEGNSENPQKAYDEMTSYQYGWEVIADNDGIYPDKMGVAAKLEFIID